MSAFTNFASSLKKELKELPGADRVSRFKKELKDLPGDLAMLKESVRYTLNPNHRHDEAHEQEIDAIRTEIAKGHRFESFGSEKEGNEVKWYIDGHDFFYALAEILDSAKETIFIMDWWLSPELFLRRPPTKHEEFRLDRLLLKKAQEGVKIMIVVYKEITQSMSLSSAHTKHHLEDMHENIAVMRHPDHLGGEITLYWSHHEKVVIVDNTIATIGGLDICFGRWDTHTFPLSDVHPTDFSRTLFAGQDYNNARVADFQAVDHWVSNQQSRLDTPRMPWHDTHMMLAGPAVMDIAQHFIERWNFIRAKKYDHDDRFLPLAFPHIISEEDQPAQAIARHPHLAYFAEIGHKFTHHAVPEVEGGHAPFGGLGPKGAMRVQVCRSSADWSSGILKEHSIMNAYCQLIAEASHAIYIENQFFCTNTTAGKGRVQNLIGKAIVERILSAARAGKKFKVVVVIPAVPGFSGDLKGSSGTLAIMGATYNGICRGGNSIMEVIEREGFNPHDYISFYNLRSYDRINFDPDRLKRMEEKSGIDFDHAQAALARVFLGSDALEEELEKNKSVVFALGIEGGEGANLGVAKNDHKVKEDREAKTVTVDLPKTFDEAWDIIHRFEQGAEPDEVVADSVTHHALKGTGSLLDEPWHGSEESERLAYVTEELYIHTKLMIVDDRRVIMGSANLNDRSQLGDHDSEIALVVEDTDMIPSRMNGEPFMAARFAATLRRQLWKEHLGLVEPQFCPPHGDEPVTSFMKMVGHQDPDVTQSEADQLVMDPLAEATENLWKGTAEKNADLFSEVFHCVPSKDVENWEQYKAFVPQAPMKPGHVARPDMDVRFIKEKLDQVHGHLVAMPLNFLCKEDLLTLDASVNPVTLSIYL